MSKIKPTQVSSNLSPRNEYLTIASKKIYLAPLKEQISNSTIIYINFNENTRNQLFPDYVDKVFYNICTKAQYDELIIEIKEYFIKSKSKQCSFCYNCLLCFYYSCNIYGNDIENITNIVQKHIKQWKFCILINVSCILNQKPMIGKNKVYGTGYNYLGEPLYEQPMNYNTNNNVSKTDTITMSDNEKAISNSSSNHPELKKPYAVWPPIGFNIILKFEGEYLRNNWIKHDIESVIKATNIHRSTRH